MMRSRLCSLLAFAAALTLTGCTRADSHSPHVSAQHSTVCKPEDMQRTVRLPGHSLKQRACCRAGSGSSGPDLELFSLRFGLRRVLLQLPHDVIRDRAQQGTLGGPLRQLYTIVLPRRPDGDLHPQCGPLVSGRAFLAGSTTCEVQLLRKVRVQTRCQASTRPDRPRRPGHHRLLRPRR